jgi:hypothetical protein
MEANEKRRAGGRQPQFDEGGKDFTQRRWSRKGVGVWVVVREVEDE